MLTRAEATQQGMKFAEKWDEEKHTVSEDGMKTFAQDLNSLNNLPAAQKNSLKWAELRGATDGLITRNVLPNLDVDDNKTKLRNCRVVGLTADGDKNIANDDLVVAIGRKWDAPSKAENVVILGQDGKFYQARQVQGGYVKSEELIAENAAELERKYTRSGFTPKSQSPESKENSKEDTKEKSKNKSKEETKEETNEDQKDKVKDKQKTDENKTAEENTVKFGDPAYLEVFKKDLKSFQEHVPSVETLAQIELNNLANEYSQLSREQQNLAFSELVESNKDRFNDAWLCGLRASRPRVDIQRDNDGAIRFSARWTDRTPIFHAPLDHQLYSQRVDLHSSQISR